MNILNVQGPDWATVNEHGLWCNFCGEILAAPHNIDDDYQPPECCKTCGAPDDAEKMAEYFT